MRLKTYLKTNFSQKCEIVVSYEDFPQFKQPCSWLKIEGLPVPQKEEAPKNEAKVEDADGALDCDVNYS